MISKDLLPITLISLLVIISFIASFYKFAITKDYTTVFHQDCAPESEQCFAYIDECGEADNLLDCGYFYSAIVVSNHAQLHCAPDAGECVEIFCKDRPGSCKEITCRLQTDYSEFGIYDACETE